MDIFQNIFMTIFGTFFLGLIIAFAFGVMTYKNEQKYVNAYMNFWLKLGGIVGTALVKLAIPVLKEIGDKIVYVTSHYLDKNKSQSQPTLIQPGTEQSATPPPPDPPPKKSSANPYDDPPEPEIMD